MIKNSNFNTIICSGATYIAFIHGKTLQLCIYNTKPDKARRQVHFTLKTRVGSRKIHLELIPKNSVKHSTGFIFLQFLQRFSD